MIHIFLIIKKQPKIFYFMSILDELTKKNYKKVQIDIY